MKGSDQMSVVEDLRKVLQDFLAPEMREVKARLDGIDKRLDQVDSRFDQVERRASERHTEILDAIRASDARMDRRVETIVDFTQIREKVAVLEAERQSKQRAAS